MGDGAGTRGGLFDNFLVEIEILTAWRLRPRPFGIGKLAKKFGLLVDFYTSDEGALLRGPSDITPARVAAALYAGRAALAVQVLGYAVNALRRWEALRAAGRHAPSATMRP